MKTIAIINEKGGTAKTTTTVSLAAALGEIGQKVLVVDLDGQAASSRWMGVEGDSRLADALIAGEGLEPIHDVLPNVDVAPASGKIDSVAHELRPTQGGQLRRVLAEVQSKFHYDYILLDCPPSLGNRLIGNAMLAATHAIVPVETSILALDGLRILLTMLKDIRQGFDHNIELLGVLACRYDARTRLSRLILSELHRALPGNVFRTVIHNTIRIQECPAVVKSILDYAPDCPAARDYRMLAKELVTGNVDGETVEEVEDLACSAAIDSSDQQTVLDFRHRAAEFFGRPIEDQTDDHSADETPGRDEVEKLVEVVTDGEEGDWSVEVTNEASQTPDDAIDEDLVVAVTSSPEPPPPPPAPPAPPVQKPAVDTFLPPVEEPSAYQPVEASEENRFNESRGDTAHWKAQRTAKLITAGLVVLFIGVVLFVQRSSFFPQFVEANRQELETQEEIPAVPPVREAVKEDQEENGNEKPAVPPAVTKVTPSESKKAASPETATPVSTWIMTPEEQTEPIPSLAATATSTSASEEPSAKSASTDDREEVASHAPPVTEPQTTEPTPEPPADPISLTFSGMMGCQGNYSASINGRWLRVGDEILGATLLEIDPMFAEVEWQQERFRLRMGEESVLRVGEGESDE